MASLDRPLACRHAKHPTDAIAGVTHASIEATTDTASDQGDAGSAGPAGEMATNRHVRVTLYGLDFFALLALVAAAAANLVIGYTAGDGTNRKKTVKNVYFDEVPQEFLLPAKDAGGRVPGFGVRGTAQWAVSDTFATMIVDAADA